MFVISQELLDHLESLKKQGQDKLREYIGEILGVVLDSNDDKRSITLLHGSDWHIDSCQTRGDRLIPAVEAILRKEFELKGKDSHFGLIDGLVSTGDHISAISDPPDSTLTTSQREKRLQSAANHLKDFSENIINSNYSKRILTVPGNHDVDIAKRNPYNRTCQYYEHIEKQFSVEPRAKNDHLSPSASVYVIPKWGLLAIFGFDSVQGDAGNKKNRGLGWINPKQWKRVGEFLEYVKYSFSDTIVVPIGALHHHLMPVAQINSDAKTSSEEISSKKKTDDSSRLSLFNARDFLKGSYDLGIRFLLHGHQHNFLTYEIKSRPLIESDEANRAYEYDCFCCSLGEFLDNHQGLYLSLLSIDFDRGLFFYAPYHSSIIERSKENVTALPVHKGFLNSITEVSFDNQRLYRHILDDSFDEKYTFKEVLTEEQIEATEDIWNAYQFPLTTGMRMNKGNKNSFTINGTNNATESGMTKEEFIDKREKRKYLLLLNLRKVGNGTDQQVEILLNHHIGIEAPLLAEWDCFLLPASRRREEESLKKNLEEFIQKLRWALSNKLHVEYKTNKRSYYHDLIKQLSKAERTLANNSNGDKGTRFELLNKSKFFENISVTSGEMVVTEYSLAKLVFEEKDNIGNTIKDTLKELDNVTAFESRYKAEEFHSKKRGLVWVPLHKWHERKADFFRNGGIMNWVENVIFKDTKKPGENLEFLEIKPVSENDLEDRFKSMLQS